MTRRLFIGMTGNSVVNTDADDFDVDTRFRMVKEAGVFDYYDKTPPPGELELYQKASQKYDLPVRAGGFYYTLGRDEPLLEWHLRMAREIGALVHNIQIRTLDADGKFVTNADVAQAYLRAVDIGDRHGVTPCFEVHVNMWSEHFGRVSEVGRLVESRGVKFNITLDHSHVMFKIDNPGEQEVQGMRADIAAGRLELDPFKPGNVAASWIAANYVRHMHARPAAPANPLNIWAKYPDGRFGRGIQYPFLRPLPGEWHSDWSEDRLEPWKEVVRQLLRHHATHADSCLGQISTEIITALDYGAGAKYSHYRNSIACAQWIRQSWNEILASEAATSPRLQQQN